MHTRDAQGRQVSLLNDDPPVIYQSPYSNPLSYQSRSGSSLSPSEVPVLTRSGSYDSEGSVDAVSPVTPGMYDCSRSSATGPYATGASYSNLYPGESRYNEHPVTDYSSSCYQRPLPTESLRPAPSSSCDEDSANSSSVPERPGKRYPCRYRDTHGCDKTFTTSGHASRHSKIHTAEKAVPCTYPNCHKKFTRADNMKQHLETHYKDKSKSGGSRSSGARRTSGSSSRTTISTNNHNSHRHHRHRSSQEGADVAHWDQHRSHHQIMAHAHSPDGSAPSPISGTTWDMNGLSIRTEQRPVKNGLDALAFAVTCQESS